VRDYYKTFLAHEVPINRVVSHGNAIGLYFQDPDGNQIEVYYPTRIDWPQPFGVPVDLINDSDEEILNAHLNRDPGPSAAPEALRLIAEAKK
jgi:catechol-2,3-dioxygenase